MVLKLAIIGSGPGGLSAAVTAARLGVDHVLLERTAHLSDTIFKYQKRKKVMAHPMRLAKLGDLPFAEGSREEVLGGWTATAERLGVNVRYNAEATKIAGQAGGFAITLGDGATVEAETVVLGIGVQGNLRRLGIPGEDPAQVFYQLDDPDELKGLRIIVVGAGDAGLENALALCGTNTVTIINRQSDFSRAKPGNMTDAERAVRGGQIRALHDSNSTRIEGGVLFVDTPTGEERVPFDRIIARLGAIPPRRFVESCGIRFPNTDPASVPELSESYESNVPGLYIVGALGGYTLIKQAINQGHEVVCRIAGRPCAPADEPLLQQRFEKCFPGSSVNDVLAYVRRTVPLLAGLTTLQLRDTMLECNLHRFAAGDLVFRRGDYTNSLWNVAEGAAAVEIDPQRPELRPRVEAGQFVGELGLRSGRRRTATVWAAEPTVMVEISVPAMRKLLSSVESVGQELDRVAVRRLIHTTLGAGRQIAELDGLIAAARLQKFKALEPIITEGDPVDALYILRSGSATISRRENGRVNVLGFVGAGSLFGERGFLDDDVKRAATIRATVASEVVRIEGGAVRTALALMPEMTRIFTSAVQSQMERSVRATVADVTRAAPVRNVSAITDFLVAKGVGEATNVFIIDEKICTRCGNCESACAATHGGISRVSREFGASAEGFLLPLACRHCETPHCMSHCPVDAISRMPSGEVIIDAGICIGCKACVNDCPYGVISMAELGGDPNAGTNWLTRMMAGIGVLPPNRRGDGHHEGSAKKAVKCDLCRNTGGVPACVTACPTGAATRLDPESFITWLREGQRAN
jgi:thioredoxin reductase/CRP-like cAMP-binding protein/Fe-S-cluster-containing hydrogenase component 2